MQQDKPTIKLTVPTGWDKLDDNQLRYVYGLLAQGFPSLQVKTYCLFRWTGMQVMHKYGKGWWCKFADDELRKRESGGASSNSNKFGLRSACTDFVIVAEQATRERRLLFCYNKTKDAPLAHPSICNKLKLF